MPLIYLSCAWVAGIYLGANLNLPLVCILAGLIPLPLLLFIRQHCKPIVLTSLCLFALFGGALRFQASLPVANEHSLQLYNGRGTVEIKGVVSTAPEVRDKFTHVQLSATEIKLGKEWQEASGTALLFVPGYPACEYGDALRVTGRLETPPRFDDFDYKAYLARQGIYSTVFSPKIEIMEKAKGFKPLGWVYSLRNSLSQALARVLPEPQASLAQGLVLGMRGNIPSSVRDDFSRSGTAHILAISGMHLSIVAIILLSIGIWLFGRRHYLYIWLALGIIWLYSLLTGMNPPVVRSAIMVSLFLLADLLGRQHSTVTALTLAAAVMAGFSPQILWTASFQMSFMAMAGLIFVYPSLQAIGRKAVGAVLGEERAIAGIANTITDSFSITLGAIVAVWPLVAYYFGIISFVAPLANLFVLPALPAIITTVALTGGLGLIALPLAQVLGWLAWLFLSYMLLVSSFFASLPLSFASVGSFDTPLLWVYYPALAAAIWLIRNWKRLAGLIPKTVSFALPRKWVIPPLLVLATLASVTAVTMPDNNLHVSFLDVGQGDAILIQRGSQQVLVDGGPSPQAITAGLGQRMSFWDRTIELTVLTHPDTDHVTGLVEVLRRYKVKHALYPDLSSKSEMSDEWLGLIRGKAIKGTIAQAGEQVDLGGVIIEVLNPQSLPLSGTASDVDNNGVVLRVSMGKVSFLLTADITQEVELELISRRAKLTSTVLKVSHHGSRTSTTPEFLAVVNPRLAVISAGADNRFGHPAPEVMERLERRLGAKNIYRTDRHGTIEFITNGERLWVKTEK